MANNTIPVRVPKEFKQFIDNYQEEKSREQGYKLPKNGAFGSLVKEFQGMKEKLKDADVIINRVYIGRKKK